MTYPQDFVNMFALRDPSESLRGIYAQSSFSKFVGLEGAVADWLSGGRSSPIAFPCDVGIAISIMPRIRTVKPEFWSHPVIAKLPDHVQLLALALINYADDEGYFRADPSLVRAFAKPFDKDSSNITGALLELSSIGYISIRENPEYGRIGKIVKFSSHQVISHPKASKLKQYFDSSNVPVMFHEASSMEVEVEVEVEPGTWNGNPKPSGDSISKPFNETEVAVALCRERGVIGVEEISLVAEAVRANGGDHIETAIKILDGWQKHRDSGKFPQQLKAFMKQGHWKEKPKPKRKYLTDDPPMELNQ